MVEFQRCVARVVSAEYAFALVPLFAWGASSTGPSYLAAGLGLIGIFMLGLGLVTAISGVLYRNKYIRLRQKYTELYDAAKKLG